jgi:GTP 3',8-cyclase
MFDSFNRHINYLRISVTDRCNLRCTYCMPAEGVPLVQHHDILSFEEIIEIVTVASQLGINKVRITGGEPLVRKGIVELVRQLSGIQGIADLSMTTNGLLLEPFAVSLKEAGLQRVNISLDCVDAVCYREITRGGDLQKVLSGIEAAKKAGLNPIKVNCVIKSTPDEINARGVAGYCSSHGLEIRYIRQMDLDNGEFYTVQGGSGGDCTRCNRLRLTANGMIKPCLFNNLEYNVRGLGVKQALQLALENKPVCGTFSSNREFYNVGG